VPVATTSSRTLQLLSLLQTHRYWPGAELADRLGVSLRTLRRDVDRLRDLGYPVEAQRGVDGGYQLAPGASLPPLVLDDDEAVALAVGLLGAARSSVAGTAEASVRALAKVVQVMPRRLRRRVQAMQAMTESLIWAPPLASIDPQTLTTVAQACRDCERLEFDYTAAHGTSAHRRVEPHRLVSLGQRWYLVAFDLDRREWRSFRLDRVDSPPQPGAGFVPRALPGDDAAAFVRAGVERPGGARQVSVVVDAPADLVRARIGQWSTVDQIDADHSRVRIQTDSLDWAAAAFVVVDAPFHSVEPAAFATHLQELAQRFTSATG
jgi:predicted DNA-binding transcriptional regulator YafY